MAARLSIASTVKLNSGHEMPQLGFGVYEAKDAFQACKTAIQVGYRHIDSARFYRNEAKVGEAARDSGVDRSSLFLTTKVFSSEHGYDPCARAVDDSVRKIGGPWDLILLHDPMGGKQKRIDAYRALVDASKAGKVKSIGVSNFGIHHLQELKAANVGPTPAINQIELHPFCQQSEIADYCKKEGIVVQAYCPLARTRIFNDPTIKSVSERYGKTPAQVLVRWSLQRGFVPLPKSDNPTRIKENADVYDFELDSDAMKQLDGLDRGDAGAISWNPTRSV